MNYNLLSVSRDAKTIKGEKYGYLTGILYLLPNKVLCPCCSEGCRKACLVSAGHGAMSNVRKARLRKTKMYLTKPALFKATLIGDIAKLVYDAEVKGLKPCVRINGTSDIDVEKVFGDVLDMFPQVQFYDYTKDWGRYWHRDNYHLTFSRSERTTDLCLNEMLKLLNKNVAVVFEKVPKYWKGFPVIPGDDSDLRFLDPAGVIVGLTAKGKAKKDTTGFVIRKEDSDCVFSEE